MKNIPHVAGSGAAAVSAFLLATACAAFAATTREIIALPRAAPAQETGEKAAGGGDAPNGALKVRSGRVAIVPENGVSRVSILKESGEVLESVGALEKMSGPIRWCFERAASIGVHVNVIGLRIEPENAAPYMEEASLQCWVTACPVY
jgi:hypothetical protein